MLQAIKGRIGTWVLRIFAILLIISFCAWGINDMIIGGGLPTDVAMVGDTNITAREFSQSFRQEMNRLRRVLGPELNSAQARQLGIADNTLNQLIDRRVLALEAQDLGILVGDDQVKQAILNISSFKNSLGEFDNVIFNQTLAQNGLSEAGFVENLRDDLAQGHLTGIISAGSTAPNYLTDQIYKYRNEKRIAEVVLITRKSTAKPPKPTDGQLREYHTKNAGLFTAPELRDVITVYLDPAILAAELKPPEERLREEFESRLASLSKPERRQLRQILAKDEKTARKVVDRLKQGAKFAEVAASETGQRSDSTKLGLLQFNDLPKILAEAAFKLPVNGTSEALKTGFGWHILLVEKIHAGKIPSFEETRATLVKEVAHEMAVDDLVKLANKLEDALAGGAQLEEAGASISIPSRRFDGIDIWGRNADGLPVSNLPKDAKFLESAFATELGQTSDLLETADGGYFVLYVGNIRPPKLKLFEKVRARVVESWNISQRDDAAKQRATEILNKINAGVTLKSIAKKNRLRVEVSKEFTRFEQPRDSNISPSLAAKLFRARKGGAAMARIATGYAVARLTEIRIARPGADKKGLDALSKQLASSIGVDLLHQFNTALKSHHPVSIDRGALDRWFNYQDGNR